MTNNLQITIIENEPRVLDLDLATRLGFAAPRQIREIIARQRDELETHGGLSHRATNSSPKGGRPGKAYYLNEAQALVICALSRTPAAATVRKALIDVFMEFRRKPVAVREHRRSLPAVQTRHQLTAEDLYEHFVSFFSAFRDQPEALAEWALARVMLLDDAMAGFAMPMLRHRIKP